MMLVLACRCSIVAALAALWALPLTVASQVQLIRACRLLDAWSCLDVAVFVVLLACLDFSSMIANMVRDRLGVACDLVKDMTAQECIAVEMAPMAAMALLVFAALSMFFLPKAMLRLSDCSVVRYVQELEAEAGEKPGKRVAASGSNDSLGQDLSAEDVSWTRCDGGHLLRRGQV
eukprot:SRR837773.18044.p1 GENE.SRR837773.18044~~SRR837773.18044.p1  ORF type:complete len:175 (-),score=70.47 SRR837773.18044:89-613(-)